jgi:dUTPase
MNRFRFIKVREVVSPNRANPNDAGLDFYVPTNLTSDDIHSKNEADNEGYGLDIPFSENFVRHIALQPGHRILIPSGIKGLLEPPTSMLMAANKSGIATKKGLLFTAEIVDSPYVGEIHIGVYNTSQETQIIKAGQKLVQFIHVPVYITEPEEIQQEEFYSESQMWGSRGDKGFGSSQIK